MNLALTSKGKRRNRLPMSNPSVHTRRAGVCPCTQLIFWYFSVAQNSESNSCCGSLESCSGSGGRSLSWGGGFHSGQIQQGATFNMLKKIWNLTRRFGSIVHLPSDDLRKVLGANRCRGGIPAGAAAPKPSAPLVRIPPMSTPGEGIWRLCMDLGEMGKLWT